MRSHLEFRSALLLDRDTGGLPQGERLARLLAENLPAYGYSIGRIFPEDWGWRVKLTHAAFSLWIGCGHYEEYADGHLCFIEPSRPHVRKWFRTIATNSVVEPLVDALEAIIGSNGKAKDLRWWSDAEVAQG